VKKFTIEVSDIIEKMNDQASKALFWNHIFLPAHMAKTTMTVAPQFRQSFSLRSGAWLTLNFLLKISTKIQGGDFFFVY